MPKYIATTDFGCYANANVLLALQNKEPLDYVLYPEVRFNKNISGEIPEHLQFIQQRAIPALEKMGVKVKHIICQSTYLDGFFQLVKKSRYPEREGLYRGFPRNVFCYMHRDAKRAEIERHFKTITGSVIEYIGDPGKERANKNRISLVKKYGLNSEECRRLCKQNGLYSPAYCFSEKIGCWFCPNAKTDELKHLKEYHPDLWEELLALGKEPEKLASPYFTKDLLISELEENFFWENQQMEIWDFL